MTKNKVTAEQKLAIDDLVYESARRIDEDRLEEWTELFAEPCNYTITTRENYDQGLPVALMSCDSPGMLRDRVLSLRHANIFNIHLTRHVVGNVQVLEVSDGVFTVNSSYAVYQTDPEGASTLFSVGRCLDEVVEEGGEYKFRSRQVIADTWGVPILLATPI